MKKTVEQVRIKYIKCDIELHAIRETEIVITIEIILASNNWRK